MKKIIILLPVYNDWESLNKVLKEISSIISIKKNFEFRCIIINDASSVNKPSVLKPDGFSSLKIINMKKNTRKTSNKRRNIRKTKSKTMKRRRQKGGE